jgi:hypothetical protein
MTARKAMGTSVLEPLRRIALRHADVVEDVACKGTAVESAAFKIRGRMFLSLRPAAAMVKLDGSLSEAVRLARAEADRYRPGSQAWTTITLGDCPAPPIALMERWIAESYDLMAAAKPARKARKKQ